MRRAREQGRIGTLAIGPATKGNDMESARLFLVSGKEEGMECLYAPEQWGDVLDWLVNIHQQEALLFYASEPYWFETVRVERDGDGIVTVSITTNADGCYLEEPVTLSESVLAWCATR